MTAISMSPEGISREHLQSRSVRLSEVRKRFEDVLDRIIARFPLEAENLASLRSGKCRVIFVLGSPRGGTSFCKAKIAAEFGLASLPGEHRALFTLLGRTFPDHGGCSEIGVGGALQLQERDFLLKGIGLDIAGPVTNDPSDEEISRYAHAWAMRITLQWVEMTFDIDAVITLVENEVRAWYEVGNDDHNDLSVAVLRALAVAYPQINPWLYDLNPALLGKAFAQRPRPEAPPSDLIVEIAPFVVPSLRRLRPLGDRPLILKASSDAYRIAELMHWFQSFETDFIHVSRNPLASVNGLLDGWQHAGFWQHQLSSLYEHAPVRPDLSNWKFDAFEGWDTGPQNLSMIDLCVEQWRAPHLKILENCRFAHRISFEHMIDPVLGLQVRDPLQRVLRLQPAVRKPQPLPPINATRPPKSARWRWRSDELLPILEKRSVRDLCKELGYDLAAYQGWN
ncbi:hypothetical protein [Erythrobacter sp.]|uniref:hypothetical protein n=1 Tax=Erythrobacter sp. TaxID=1042 RepID=UPI003C7529AE